MRRTCIGLAMASAMLLGGACDSSTSVVPRSEGGAVRTHDHTADQLEAALPSVDQLPEGYKVQVSCRAPKDPTCDLEAPAPGDYAVFAATRGKGIGVWDLTDSVHVVAGRLETPQHASAVVSSFRDSMQRDFTGRIDVAPRSDHGTGYVPGERGTGALESFRLGDWRGALATKTTRMVEPSGRTSPPGTIATISVANGRITLTVSTVSWSGRLTPSETENMTQTLLEEYVGRLPF